MADESPAVEQRTKRRFALRLPVHIAQPGSDGPQTLATTTRDISASGICFYLDEALAPGAPIEFTLTLPEEITLSQPIRVRCKGRVVRESAATAEERRLVAAVIDDYEFVPEG